MKILLVSKLYKKAINTLIKIKYKKDITIGKAISIIEFRYNTFLLFIKFKLIILSNSIVIIKQFIKYPHCILTFTALRIIISTSSKQMNTTIK